MTTSDPRESWTRDEAQRAFDLTRAVPREDLHPDLLATFERLGVSDGDKTP